MTLNELLQLGNIGQSVFFHRVVDQMSRHRNVKIIAFRNLDNVGTLREENIRSHKKIPNHLRKYLPNMLLCSLGFILSAIDAVVERVQRLPHRVGE